MIGEVIHMGISVEHGLSKFFGIWFPSHKLNNLVEKLEHSWNFVTRLFY